MSNIYASKNRKGGIGRAMLEKLAKAVGTKDATLATFEKHFKRNVVILILDEIDMLFDCPGGADCFQRLVAYAEMKNSCFSMIGISNSVNDEHARRIRRIGHVSVLQAIF